MAIGHVVTRGYGNGTQAGAVSLVVVRGFSPSTGTASGLFSGIPRTLLGRMGTTTAPPGAAAGYFSGAFRWLLGRLGTAGTTPVIVPDPGDVRLGVVYDADDLPAVSDVRLGVVYGDGSMIGTLVLPAEDEVEDGVQYGADGTEYTGTFVGSDCPPPPVPVDNLIPFALIAQQIVQRVALALGTSTDWVHLVANDEYRTIETESLFAYVRPYGLSFVDATTGQPFGNEGSGRWRRVVGRRVRIYIYTRSGTDIYGTDDISLGGTDETQNVTTPPTLPGQFVSEELVANALDGWTPTYTDPTELVLKPYTIGPIHLLDSEGGPPERPAENEQGLVRSHLDIQVCYRLPVQRVEPAPDGLPVPDHG